MAENGAIHESHVVTRVLELRGVRETAFVAFEQRLKLLVAVRGFAKQASIRDLLNI